MPNYESLGFKAGRDSFNNIYFGGLFGGVSDFDPGIGVYQLTSAGTGVAGSYSGNHFILSLDTTGTFRWASGFGGPTVDEP